MKDIIEKGKQYSSKDNQNQQDSDQEEPIKQNQLQIMIEENSDQQKSKEKNNQQEIFQHNNEQEVENPTSGENLNENSNSDKQNTKKQKIDLESQKKCQVKRFTFKDDSGNAYNPYALPPDIQISEQHRKAWSIGPKEKDSKLCKCCGFQYERKILSLNCDNKEFSYLGSGIPQFLMFIKFSTFFLILLFAVSGLYGISTNSEGSDCITPESEEDTKQGCHNNWITYFSLGNKRSLEGKMLGQQLMNLLTICIIIIFLQILRRQIRIIDNECDDQDISAQDYTVILKFLPIDFEPIHDDYDEDLRQFLENPKIMKNQYNVTNINLIYNTNKYLKLSQKFDELKKKQIGYELKKQRNKKINEEKYENLIKEINEIDNQLQLQENQFHEGSASFNKKLYTGQALVSFKTEQQKDQILEDFNIPYLKQVLKNKYGLIYQGKEIVVEEAPDPRNIQWENQQFTTLQKFLRRCLTLFLNTIILIGCGGTIILLKLIQKEAADTKDPEDSDNPLTRFLGIIISGVILLLNAMISFTIKICAEKESYSTFTSKLIGIAKGTIVAQFFNTALLTFLIDVYFSKDDKYYSIFKTGGLAYNIFYVFISNSILPPIMGIIDIPTRLQQVKQKKALLNIQDGDIVQKDLNTIYEKPIYDISQGYAVILKTLYFSAFYSVIIPFGLLFSILGLIAQYWIEKYTIVRKRMIKQSISKQLAIEMVEMLEYTLPIFALSNMIFFIYTSDQEFPIAGLVGVLISIGNAFLPMQFINEKLFKLKETQANDMEYDTAYYQFSIDYARENPATKVIAIELHKQKIYQFRQNILKQQKQTQITTDNKEQSKQDFTKVTQDDVSYEKK